VTCGVSAKVVDTTIGMLTMWTSRHFKI